MRIVGYIKNEACKVTVFHQGLRFMVKFEDGLYEQAFKFRESETIKGLADIQNLVDDTFVQEVMERFTEMRRAIGALMTRALGTAPEEEEVEEII